MAAACGGRASAAGRQNPCGQRQHRRRRAAGHYRGLPQFAYHPDPRRRASGRRRGDRARTQPGPVRHRAGRHPQPARRAPTIPATESLPADPVPGSAVAVALGIADLDIGTYIPAGSGRVPAAFHGLIGIKLTLGLIRALGVVPACGSDYDRGHPRSPPTPRRRSGCRDHGRSLRTRPAQPRWPPTSDSPRRRVAGQGPRASSPRCAPTTGAAFARHRGRTAASGGMQPVQTDISVLLDAARLLYDGAIVAQRYAAVGDFVHRARRPGIR